MKRVSKTLSLTIASTLVLVALVLASPALALAAPERAEGPVTIAQRVVSSIESMVAKMAGIFATSIFANKSVTVEDQDDEPPLDPALYLVEPHG